MGYLLNGEGSTVTAQRLADIYASIFGADLHVTVLGSQMAATIVDNNTVRVADGVAVKEGRMVEVEESNYDEFTIPTGTQGATKHYYIGYHLYTDSDGKEQAEKVVSETQTSATGFRAGGTEMYIWLYDILLNGVVLESATRIAPVHYGARNIKFGTAAPDNSDGEPDGTIYVQLIS